MLIFKIALIQQKRHINKHYAFKLSLTKLKLLVDLDYLIKLKIIIIYCKLKILDLLQKKDASSKLEFMCVKYFDLDALRTNSDQIKKRLEVLREYIFKIRSFKQQSFSVHSIENKEEIF